MKNYLISLLSVTCLSHSCARSYNTKKSVKTDTSIGYNLSAADRVYVLPEVLQEISGITEIDSSTIACIQDEREIVFMYDLNSSQIIRQIDCGYTGDYEGITRVDSTLYILRSDGVLSKIKIFESEKFVRSAFFFRYPMER